MEQDFAKKYYEEIASEMLLYLQNLSKQLLELKEAASNDEKGKTINNNLDIGSNLILRKYERWRKGHNIFMLALMDGFKRLFGSDISVCRYLRNAGLRLFDKNKWVKKEISRFAMGISGDLPEFCKVLSRDIVEKF